MMKTDSKWSVYLLRCKNNSLYCGITNNVEARYEAHQNGTGAKYTRANPPVKIVAVVGGLEKSQAAKIEYAIKRFPANKKIQALQDMADELESLTETEESDLNDEEDSSFSPR